MWLINVSLLWGESQLRDAAKRERTRERAEQLEKVAPHVLRHSLARRMLKNGARLPEVQRGLGYTRLSTTGIYLTPSEDDLRAALGHAGLSTSLPFGK